MEENYENPKEQDRTEHNNSNDCNTSTCWLKYLVVSLAAFFGAFLAVYFVVDQTVHRYILATPPHFMPMPKELSDSDIAKLIKNQEKMQEKMFDDGLRISESQINPFVVNPVKIDTFKDKDAYIIMVDLKPFNNDPNKIKVDIKPMRIKISGESNEIKKGTENEVSFLQNFSLPQRIDVEDATKEVKGDKYIIKLPIDD